MTLQSSASTGDPLNFSEIQSEFSPQGSAGNLLSYIKNAGIVDANDNVPSVPTSAPITILNFLSGECVHAALSSYNPSTYDIMLTRVAATHPSLSTARVGIQLNDDGTAIYYYSTHNIGTTNFTSFTWKLGSGSVGNYYAYMYAPTGDSFSVNAGTDSALQLNSTRNWRLDVSSTSGTVSKELNSTLEIRNASGAVITSKTLRFYVEADVS